jgi:hypothetical protein
MTPDNPRRHVGYMVGILKKWAEEDKKKEKERE